MIHMTNKKLAANRANAQKSTGPTTPNGKAVSRMNRLRHGIYAEDVIVPQLNESKEYWEEFRQIYLDELNPQSLIQYTLAEQYIFDQWRLLRYRRIETGFAAQAWARNDSILPSLRRTNIIYENDYPHFDTTTRLGKSRASADGFGATTFNHDHFSILQRSEIRIRRAAAETLKQFYAAAPDPEVDPEPDPKPAFVPAPIEIRFKPKSPSTATDSQGKPPSPEVQPNIPRPPDIGEMLDNASAKGVKR